ncbi:hypothetical protein LJ737_05075 [Hymenobacter sp. 15J16-1T3B]|uniref:hypothetical protein n=1 Tax=Hymenobacter sp. 15J16-1T3B TaxID=2886941 RepID=UPI001D120B39|nr:hypothetical protein [Hymenobacter sp. 15J16-1T3B]MCC3156599.1 hypothetical protein [Hymenobacter sp. 15J16-1T3B]
MIRVASFVLTLFLAVGLLGCGSKKADPQPDAPLDPNNHVLIEENNGTAYYLSDVSATASAPGPAPATLRVWVISGKLKDGRLLRLQFNPENSGSPRGRAEDFSSVTLDNAAASQTNGQVNYLSTDNTISGAFLVYFGLSHRIYGSFQGLKL